MPSTSSPTVSVLVTIYNRAHFIEETVRSILQSDYEDYEIILLDDRSKDDSYAVAKKLAESDPRIRAYQNEENLGDYPNRNAVAAKARGKYLKYVDADDVIYPHTLGLMVRAMESHPEAGLGLEHSEQQAAKPYPFLLSSEQAYQKHFIDRGCLSCGPSGAIMRRDAFAKLGGFGAYGVASDNDMWLRLAALSDVILFGPGLMWWRIHEGQEIRSAKAQREYLILGYQVARQALTADTCPLKPADREAALQKIQQHQARRIIALAVKGKNLALAREACEASGLSWAQLLKGLNRYAK
ncbi:glycosyltransferase family 2 protein [Cerasicoccus fimbriatus]|uniref:glycosyltransferase family 2 protein n=1 Tax=Cerasicoccus fimbriatus TaxID=3014554 RepID=UPI0022B3BB53|nr:glycosyltransferase family A protein [Cerasicoccus sp. TK19100]